MKKAKPVALNGGRGRKEEGLSQQNDRVVNGIVGQQSKIIVFPRAAAAATANFGSPLYDYHANMSLTATTSY